jgi:hypothetical protein
VGPAAGPFGRDRTSDSAELSKFAWLRTGFYALNPNRSRGIDLVGRLFSTVTISLMT